MGAKKPIASLCIIFYNQEEFVKDAVEGALSQTFDDCEIVLSDDHSSDRTLDLIKDVVSNYHGNKTIIINENDHNLGLVPHVNEVIYHISSGRYIFLTGGDDISLPNRVEEGVKYFENNPNLSMVTFSTIYINKDNEEIGRHLEVTDRYINIGDKSYLCSASFMAGLPGQGFRRDILEEYGPMGDAQTEDSVLRFRSLLKGTILCSSVVGLKYRVHNNNISSTNRIYNLKTQKIAEQYKKDLCLQKNYISHNLYSLLERKIDFYIVYRRISEKQNKGKIFVNWYYRLEHFFLRKYHELRVLYFLYFIERY